MGKINFTASITIYTGNQFEKNTQERDWRADKGGVKTDMGYLEKKIDLSALVR